MSKTKSTKKSELQSLQGLVVAALKYDLESSLQSGEVSHASIKNALQLLRDNNIVAEDDIANDMAALERMLPPLDLNISTMKAYSR